MSNLPTSQQRDAIKEISPPSLCQGNNERYMYNLGLAYDVLLEKMNQAVSARMPGRGTVTANPYLGLDRVMTQGPVEPHDTFSKRLSKSLDTWRLAGNRMSVLGQASIYLQQFFDTNIGQIPRLLIVSTATSGAHAVWDWYYNDDNIDNPPNHVRKTTANWDWDGSHLFWRAWFVFFIEAGSTLQKIQWGTGRKWGNTDICWGTSCSPKVWEPLRSLFRLWKSNTWYQWFVVSFAPGDGGPGDEFSPNSTAGAGNPDGTWKKWGRNVNGVYRKARSANAIYGDGTQTYSPDCYIPTDG